MLCNNLNHKNPSNREE